MSDDRSPELKVAESVAELTAQRFRENMKEELDARDESLRQHWRSDLGKLRDDLTARNLLDGLQNIKGLTSGEDPVRLLVVDDYPEVLRAFVRTFKNQGMLVQEASSGSMAAALLESDSSIEVIIADISMPKNGYTLLEHVLQHYPLVEVVMTSGIESEATRARQLGAFAFLSKPFKIDHALLLVERAAEFRRFKIAAMTKS